MVLADGGTDDWFKLEKELRDFASRIWEYCMFEEQSANISLSKFTKALALQSFSYFDAEYYYKNEIIVLKNRFVEAKAIADELNIKAQLAAHNIEPESLTKNQKDPSQAKNAEVPVNEANLDGGEEPLLAAQPVEKEVIDMKKKIAKHILAHKQQVKNEKQKVEKQKEENAVIEKTKTVR